MAEKLMRTDETAAFKLWDKNDLIRELKGFVMEFIER